MFEIVQYIKEFGAFSVDSIWFPILVWTLCSTFAFLTLSSIMKNINPLFHYHLRSAALLALPLGILASFLLKLVPQLMSAPELETAFFVMHSPIEIVKGANLDAGGQGIIWQEPSFFIGVVSLLFLLVSAIMMFRFIASYVELRRLYHNLELIPLNLKEAELKGQNIHLAFHSHPLVPFTFGWKNPVIVLPEIIRNEPEKLQMALQHELTHIKRGDYVLQLALSIIHSLFWFHPLVHFGNKEIDTYREISCDQEVLSKSGFSIKSYANLLYELVPLNSSVGRLSVSMAVHNSTLKQRIKTMKHYKLYKTSFRQSIFFLLLMIVGITLPIACSDLRGPSAISNDELEHAEIRIHEPTLTVNDIEVKLEAVSDFTTSGLGAIVILSEYGSFKIAPRQFDGGIQSGKIDGNALSFRINQLNVKLSSASEILPGFLNTPIWVKHNPEMNYFSGIIKMENALAEIAPPPPANKPMADIGDFFVVVEEMPEPIGGAAAIQSRVQYPELARRAGIEGKVTVQFVVTATGDVVNAQVIRGIGGGCDEEALRVVKESKFKPGVQRGRPVNVQLTLSLNFNLSDADFAPPVQG